MADRGTGRLVGSGRGTFSLDNVSRPFYDTQATLRPLWRRCGIITWVLLDIADGCAMYSCLSKRSLAPGDMGRHGQSGIWLLTCALMIGVLIGGCASRETARRSADEWYDLGQSQLARGKYTRAEHAFSKLLEQHPQDRRRPEALLGLADALYADKRYEEAKFQYRRFLELYPVHPEAAKAQFNIAMSAFQRMKAIDRDQDTTHEALQEFQRLVQSYPRSPLVGEAKEKIAACRERLAAYELYVGRFYYKKGAYPAAIGRFTQVLQAYPEVSFADEALFLLGDTYVANESPQEAASVFDELVKRYPQSRFANQAKGRLASLR